MSFRNILMSLASVTLATVLVGCGPEYPKCDNDDDCASSERGKAEGKTFCLNGLCQQCKEDSHCGDASLECVAGSCEQIPGFCSSTSDCPGNQKCRGNRCGAECESNDECADGQECQGGSCVAKAECTADADCTDGQVCESGRCVSPSACQLDTVYFGYDDASVDGDARSTLQRNAECIKSRNLSVTIEGHCDERGTSEYNIALGERRARNASEYLRSLGVARDKINTLSYGEERLVRECGEEGPESCHRMNRRAEMSIR